MFCTSLPYISISCSFSFCTSGRESSVDIRNHLFHIPIDVIARVAIMAIRKTSRCFHKCLDMVLGCSDGQYFDSAAVGTMTITLVTAKHPSVKAIVVHNLPGAVIPRYSIPTSAVFPFTMFFFLASTASTARRASPVFSSSARSSRSAFSLAFSASSAPLLSTSAFFYTSGLSLGYFSASLLRLSRSE